MDISKKLMVLRDEADACHKASSNLKKDAARLYAAADKVWSAKQMGESIRAALLRKGPILMEPDVINETVDDCIQSLVESGVLGA